MLSQIPTGQEPETHRRCGRVSASRTGGTTESGDSMSDVLYVPIRRRDSSGQVELEMRTLPDGRLALPAYTSLEELVRCCGPRQPWMGVDSTGLREIHRTTGYDVVLLDGRQPPPPRVEDEDRPFEDPLGRRATR